jgi:hypothetical protein
MPAGLVSAQCYEHAEQPMPQSGTVPESETVADRRGNWRRKSRGERACMEHAGGFKAVYQRQRLLISEWGRSSESRPGENPMSGLTREPEES